MVVLTDQPVMDGEDRVILAELPVPGAVARNSSSSTLGSQRRTLHASPGARCCGRRVSLAACHRSLASPTITMALPPSGSVMRMVVVSAEVVAGSGAGSPWPSAGRDGAPGAMHGQ